MRYRPAKKLLSNTEAGSFFVVSNCKEGGRKFFDHEFLCPFKFILGALPIYFPLVCFNGVVVGKDFNGFCHQLFAPIE
jgi:hypothetical protein